MARITAFQSGNVSDEGKQNWRGDQVSVTPGNQSVFDTSSVPLAELGARKVVGDRVFRYAQAGATISEAGAVCGSVINADTPATVGGLGYSGQKVFTYYASTNKGANFFAEGYLICHTATDGNEGLMLRIKSHTAAAATGSANITLNLYDALPLDVVTSAASKWFACANPYKGVVPTTGGVSAPAGVTPIAVSTSDYFWLQTWGPTPVRAAACTSAGNVVVVGATTGAAIGLVQSNTVPAPAVLGCSMQVFTASAKSLLFLMIAP